MIRIVRMSFKPEYSENFEALFNERKELIRQVDGCTYLELWQDEHQPNVYFTYSVWSHPNDLEQYRISPLFIDTWTTVKQWFNESPQAFSANKRIQLP